MLLHQDFAILHPLVHMDTDFMPCKALEGGLSRNTGPASCKSLISAQLASWGFYPTLKSQGGQNGRGLMPTI
jgi:hypothetical protein